MNIIVFLIGLLISIMGILFIFKPSYFKKIFEKYLDKNWLLWAILLRVVIGILLIFASNETRYPLFILWLGIVVILSAILLPIIGKERVTKLIKWWLDLPAFVTVIWAVIAFLFGLFIIYSANI